MKKLDLSIKAHDRLYLQNVKKYKSAKDINSIATFKTKYGYHQSASSWQKNINRKLTKTEKKQLYRAFENRTFSDFSLPTKKYRNQPNYINFK
jgi:hypothetical protein